MIPANAEAVTVSSFGSTAVSVPPQAAAARAAARASAMMRRVMWLLRVV